MNRADMNMGAIGKIFDIGAITTPYIVQVFTALRQSTCQVNDLGYPELRCRISECDDALIGETSSKLTMALSIHVDSFLGLTCSETISGSAELSARFSHLCSADYVCEEINIKAADIIDTLMALQ